MFELAGLSAFLDIFQKAFGLIEKRRDQKQRIFKEIVEPIYTQLAPAVGEYYEFFRGCRDAFSQTEFNNWHAVLRETRKKREEIVLARNTVLGFISPFLREQRDRNADDDKLFYDFADAIRRFFYASDNIPGRTIASSLFESIEGIVERGDEKYKGFVIKYIERVLRDLERDWESISYAYAKLKNYYIL